jgi:hypothetical protein
MHMTNSLPSILSILAIDLILILVYLLQLLADLVRSHKEVDTLNLRKILQFDNLPSRTDQHVPSNKCVRRR